jgi:hypothetical protein
VLGVFCGISFLTETPGLNGFWRIAEIPLLLPLPLEWSPLEVSCQPSPPSRLAVALVIPNNPLSIVLLLPGRMLQMRLAARLRMLPTPPRRTTLLMRLTKGRMAKRATLLMKPTNRVMVMQATQPTKWTMGPVARRSTLRMRPKTRPTKRPRRMADGRVLLCNPRGHPALTVDLLEVALLVMLPAMPTHLTM